ncbi:DUF4276 family protein [Streptomyces mirabilis]|uniref:DUF4276 family protein n=1 Tax=Streptomyces mirabilis TaxID=68239 RepID=UPI0021C1E72D|nr:DUF4276 family protein [Streptomyces mirabilis]MCT9107032.1 DUF4276 family protein [Streptomyces mirabilis]
MTHSAPPLVIASVVEGDGEIQALPKLLHRIAGDLDIWHISTPRPARVPRSQLVKAGGIENAVLKQAEFVRGHAGGVLVLLDADDDCPASLGPTLLARAQDACHGVPVAVVLPSREYEYEYESWFLAAADSLAGVRDFLASMTAPAQPDTTPRDAKGWLTYQRGKHRPHSPTADQAPLTSAMSLTLARANSPSFDKLCRDAHYLMTGKRGA